MGQFSWIYADNRKQMIDNRHADSYLLVPPAFQEKYGKYIHEGCYDGYGHMGKYDVYDLVAEWNREFLSADMLRDAPKLENYGGLDRWDRAELADRGFSEEEIAKIDKQKQKEAFDRAMRWFNQDVQMLSDYKTGKEDKAMARDYGKDWKRELGIAIACYDEQNAALPYPIKITSKPMEYDEIGPSISDPNQGWEVVEEHDPEDDIILPYLGEMRAKELLYGIVNDMIVSKGEVATAKYLYDVGFFEEELTDSFGFSKDLLENLLGSMER